MAPAGAAGVWLLTLGAVAGLDVRPAADDWCAVGWLEEYGTAGMVYHYYADVNGRLANAAAQALIHADGLRGARLLPSVLVLALTTGVFTVVFLALRHLRWRWPAASAGLVAVVVSALTFFAGNKVYQVFYWPAGTVSHTLPAIMGLWNLAFALVAARSRSWVRVAAVVVSFLGGFTMGTLSEPFFVVSGVYASAAVVLALSAWRDRRTRFPLAWLSAWIIGLLAGFAVLYTSPGMEIRTGRTRPQSSLLSADGLSEALQGWQHTWATIASQPGYYATVAAGLLVGLLGSTVAVRGTSLPFSGGAWTRARTTVVLILPAAMVVVASFAVLAGLRQGYGLDGWTYQRAWTNFLPPALLTATLYGVAGGYALGRRLGGTERSSRPPAMVALVVLTALLSAACLVSLVPANSELAGDMARRAEAWDANDRAVERQVRDGRRVVGFTPNPIARSTEPFKYTVPGTDWVAGCAASYYGADKLVPSRAWLSSPESARYRSQTGSR